MKRREFIAGLGAALWPVMARAQQPALPVIGALYLSQKENSRLTAAFRQGLAEQGFVEGRNIEMLYRWAEFQADRLPTLANDLVRRRVAVIFANPTVTVLAAKAATAAIPIVFAVGADPVAVDLVASLNRPGGNTTGVAFLTAPLIAKRLELLREIVPAATSVGYLINRKSLEVESQIKDAQTASVVLGVRLNILDASAPGDFEAAFTNLTERHIGALLIGSDPLFASAQAVQLAELASRYAVPMIHYVREFVDAGGLISYGASLSDAWRLAATYVGQILKGAKPADLPVQQSTRVEMVLNLKAAKALGLKVPTSTLLRADEVIE